MTVGITLSPAPAANAVDSYVELATFAAEAGVGTVWVAQFFDVDALSVAAVIGHQVPDISIGTAVVPTYPRHPLVVASQAATAQAASGGRFQLGIGLGSRPLVEQAYGVSTDRAIRHLREYLTVLRTVLSAGSVDFHGETLTAVTPMPVAVAGATKPPPLLVGSAAGTQVLRVAGELADGVFSFLAGPQTIADVIAPCLAKASSGVGRDDPRIIAVIPAVVTSDVAGVKATAAEQLAFYDGVPAAQKSVAREGIEHAHEMAIIGDEAHVSSAIDEYFDAGATEVSIAYSHISTAEDHRRTISLAGQLNQRRTALAK